MQHNQTQHQADRGFQRHQRPERGVGHPAQGDHLQRERRHRKEQRDSQRRGDDAEGQVPVRFRNPDNRGRECGNRNGDGKAGDAVETVPNVLGQHDVGAPADGAENRESDTHGVDAALPRLGEQDDAHQGQRRPDQCPPRSALHGGHRERTEEFDGDGRSQRDALDREHERCTHDAGGHTEGEQSRIVAAGDIPEPRPCHRQEDEPAGGQPKPGGPGRTDRSNDAHGQRRTELSAQHRHHRQTPRRQAADTGSGCGGHRPMVSPARRTTRASVCAGM